MIPVIPPFEPLAVFLKNAVNSVMVMAHGVTSGISGSSRGGAAAGNLAQRSWPDLRVFQVKAGVEAAFHLVSPIGDAPPEAYFSQWWPLTQLRQALKPRRRSLVL